MKLTLVLFTLSFVLVTLSSSNIGGDSNVNLSDLRGKEFKHIVKFDSETSAEEIESTLDFLKKFNSSIEIIRSVDKVSQKISFEISSKSVKCKSDNFGYGIILLDNNYLCECAIGDKDSIEKK